MPLDSLREAVLDIVNEMLAEVKDLEGEDKDAASIAANSYLRSTLRGYARQLRTACKAAGEDVPAQSQAQASQMAGLSALLLNPQAQHVMEVDKYRAEFRKKKEMTPAEERYDGDMVEVIGGPAHLEGVSTTQAVDPAMPIGASVPIAGGMYRLEKGSDGVRKLVYNEERTKELQKVQGTMIHLG